MKSIAAIFLIFTFTGCSEILSKVYNVHHPRPESVENITKFSRKAGIDSSQLVLIHENSFFMSLYENLNNAVLFDPNGYSINYEVNAENPDCGGNILGVLEGLGKETYFPRDSSRVFGEEMKRWVTRNNEPVNTSIAPSGSDYYVVYYWNMFSGTPNHRWKIRDLRKKIKENPRVRIHLILVNQDIRPDMDLEKQLNEYKAAKSAQKVN